MHQALINPTAPVVLAVLLCPVLLPKSPRLQHPLRGEREARMHTVARPKGDSAWGLGGGRGGKRLGAAPCLRVHRKSRVLSHHQQTCHLCHPAWARQHVSPSRPGAAGGSWVLGLQRHLGHGESEELLLMQEGGLTLS